VIHQWSGKDANSLMPKCGPKPSELSITIATAFFESRIGVGTANEVCANAGILSPTASSHHKQVEKMQKAARTISEEQLQKNCSKHVLACCSLPTYLGDMQFNGRSTACGPISMDCHQITSSQPILVVFSELINKPI
jgi:hypothetical protein